MPAVSPPNLANWNPQRAPQDEEDTLCAGPRRCARNYRAIIDAGTGVQIDDPLLASYLLMHPEASVEDCRKMATGR